MSLATCSLFRQSKSHINVDGYHPIHRSCPSQLTCLLDSIDLYTETGGYQGYQGGDAFGHDDNRLQEEKKGSGPVGYSDKEQLLGDGEEKQGMYTSSDSWNTNVTSDGVGVQ